MELAGLEPATSWVRCGDAIVRGRRRFLALESGTVAHWIPPRQGTDSRGLPWITFDLGTRDGPVPIHLPRRSKRAHAGVGPHTGHQTIPASPRSTDSGAGNPNRNTRGVAGLEDVTRASQGVRESGPVWNLDLLEH